MALSWGGVVPLVAVLTGIAALAFKSLFQCLKVKKFARYNIKNLFPPPPQPPRLLLRSVHIVSFC